MLEYLIDDSLVVKEDRIAVACSGGADSMLLLWAMLDKQKQTGFYFEVINVNHHLRGNASDEDSLFVEEFCKKRKIPCKIIDVDVKKLKNDKKMTLEQSARVARYDAIYAVMKKEKLNKLFLAHHKNDQAETILMHIFRGSGISGACGIKVDEVIKRPFLNLKKSEILKLATEHGVKFVTDESNADNQFSRNYLRNIVIPEIEKMYPGVVDAVCLFGERCKEVQDFIRSQVNENLIQQVDCGYVLKLSAFENPNFIVREYFKVVFERLGVFADIESKHYELLSALVKKDVNTSIDLTNKLVAKKTYDGIKISKKSAKIQIETEFDFVIGKLHIDGFGDIITKEVEAEDVEYADGSLYVDGDKISTNAVWRFRKLGDNFSKLGTGSKKLNDYFTDKKFDVETRDFIPVLASGNQVFVVAGHDISEKVKVDGETDTIVKITFVKDSISWQLYFV